jgi:hypothetical protein
MSAVGTMLTMKIASGVVPGSTTFDSGSGNYSVPAYNTLTIELWGGGAAGGPNADDFGSVAGVNGNASTVSTYSLSAGGGLKSASDAGANPPGGVGGTASGGNTTNTNGNAGGQGTWYSGTYAGGDSGAGGNAPGSGGSGGAGQGIFAAFINGNPGGAPGGGGGGAIAGSNPSGPWRGYQGAGSGAYVRHVFTFGSGGAPSVGALIAYAVAATVSSSSGAGSPGRIRFTVT